MFELDIYLFIIIIFHYSIFVFGYVFVFKECLMLIQSNNGFQTKCILKIFLFFNLI